jgi:hypothetical protein
MGWIAIATNRVVSIQNRGTLWKRFRWGQVDNQTPLPRFSWGPRKCGCKSRGRSGPPPRTPHLCPGGPGPRWGGHEPAPDRWESELETGWSWLAGILEVQAGTVADNVRNGGALLAPEIGVILQPTANNEIGWRATWQPRSWLWRVTFWCICRRGLPKRAAGRSHL